MKARFVVLAVCAIVAIPAMAQKVHVDYDKNYEFTKERTYAWADSADNQVAKSDPLLHSRIVGAIDHYLAQGGFAEVESDPTLYITYHTNTKENLSLNTTSFGYGYPGGWGPYGRGYYGYGGYGAVGVGTSSTTVSSYQTGTLVVDVWDAATEKLVWRGIADNITVSTNPDKMAGKIDKALAKMVKKWQSINKKAGK